MEYAPASESAALTGDYVGIESCIDLRNDDEFEAYARDCERSYDRRRQRRNAANDVAVKEAREFPPPITYLARTENQASHMPWVMKRYFTTDGRLVIREEKVRHHEYFRANRANGRLTLQLISPDTDNENVADENVDDVEVVSQESTELSMLENVDVNENVDSVEVANENVEEIADKAMVSSVPMAEMCVTDGARSGGGMLTSASSACIASNGGGNKCYGFNSLRSSSALSLFHLQVPAIRPVIS